MSGLVNIEISIHYSERGRVLTFEVGGLLSFAVLLLRGRRSRSDLTCYFRVDAGNLKPFTEGMNSAVEIQGLEKDPTAIRTYQLSHTGCRSSHAFYKWI